MERKRINSSKIRSAGYDRGSQVLELEFSDGKVIAYSGVSEEIYRRFASSPSPASFFEDRIAEDFPGKRVK